MSDNITQVQKAGGPRVAGDDLPPSALEHGALTLFDDNEAVFTGNGVTTPTDVMARVIELNADTIDALKVFVDAREAHVFAAQRNLLMHNPHLRGQDAERPVPAGQQFFARGGDDLKALLAPFKNNMGALREMVGDARTGLGGRSTTTGHGVHSRGLDLPMTGEPEPVPTAAAQRIKGG
jgi:hypothetical protein